MYRFVSPAYGNAAQSLQLGRSTAHAHAQPPEHLCATSTTQRNAPQKDNSSSVVAEQGERNEPNHFEELGPQFCTYEKASSRTMGITSSVFSMLTHACNCSRLHRSVLGGPPRRMLYIELLHHSCIRRTSGLAKQRSMTTGRHQSSQTQPDPALPRAAGSASPSAARCAARCTSW